MALNEFIQLVDNNTNARGKSRFRNKNLSNCKLVIVTTVLTMDELLRQLDPRRSEDWKQFRRRFKLYITVCHDHIEVSQYSFSSDLYGSMVKLDNPIKHLVNQALNESAMSAEELSQFLCIPALPTSSNSEEDSWEAIQKEEQTVAISPFLNEPQLEPQKTKQDNPFMIPENLEGLTDVELPF